MINGLFGQDEVKRKKQAHKSSKDTKARRKFRLGGSSGPQLCNMTLFDDVLCEEPRKSQAVYPVACDARKEVWAFITPCIAHDDTLIIEWAKTLPKDELQERLRRDWSAVVEEAITKEAHRGN